MAIYQFLIAVRHGGPHNAAAMLTNADGETTSHIQGLFNRTIRYLMEGIRPVFVFDGKLNELYFTLLHLTLVNLTLIESSGKKDM